MRPSPLSSRAINSHSTALEIDRAYLQEAEEFLVAEYFVGNRPDAVLFQMTLYAKQKDVQISI